MTKRLILLLLLGLSLVVAALWYHHSRSRDRGERYALAPFEWGALCEATTATGELQPRDAIVVCSPLSGQVVEVYPGADVNREVREGDPLLKLDDRLAAAKLEQAETAVRAAQADLDRVVALRDAARIGLSRQRDLLQKELGSHRGVELAQTQLGAADAGVAAARTKVAEARAARKLAELGLDLTVVRVPSSAGRTASTSASKQVFTIIDRSAVVGQLAGPPAAAHLFTLASDLGQMRLHARVSQDDVGKVRPGLTANFSLWANFEGETRIQGRVEEIRPMPSQLHGLVFYDALIDVANRRNPQTREWLLRPGMTVSATIHLRTHTEVWKMPALALDFQVPENEQTEAARAKLARWQERKDSEEWMPAWVLDEHRDPWPIFVRTGGKNAGGQTGISDGRYAEVLEWDPDLKPQPDPHTPATFPKLIIGSAPARSSGLFDHTVIEDF